MSDAAASCTKARSEFIKQDKYKHVVQQRCIAHLLNLIGKDISEHEEVQDIVRKATTLVNTLNYDSKVMAEFTRAGQRRCSRYVKTRWYSMVSVLETLVDCEDIAIAALSKVIRESRAQMNLERVESLETLQSDLFGPNVRILVSIFRPLANCIAIAESKESHLGDAMKAMLEFAKSLFDSDWEIEYVVPTIMAFLTHFNTTKLHEDGLGLMLSAYFLDKRNNRNYVTDEGAKLVLKTLYDLGRAMDFTVDQVGGSLGYELKAYYLESGSYSRKADPNETAEEWWRGQPDIGILKTLALRVVSLRSSSANIERLFSVMKTIQAPNRLRLSLSSLTNIARAKIANNWSPEPSDECDFDADPPSPTDSNSVRREYSFSVDLEKGADAFNRNLETSSLGPLDTDIDSQSSDSDQGTTVVLPRPKSPHHLTKRFKRHPNVKESYRQFFKIFDFSNVNEGNSSEKEVAEEDNARFGLQAVLESFGKAIKNAKKK